MPKKTNNFSHSEYYLKNKEDIKARKQERYRTDAQYREAIKANASANYAKKRGVDTVAKVSTGIYKINGVDYYSVSYIAQRTNVSSQLVNYYILNGILPEPRKLPNYLKRLFSYELMEVVVTAIGMYQSKQIAKATDIPVSIKDMLGDKYKELIHHVSVK